MKTKLLIAGITLALLLQSCTYKISLNDFQVEEQQSQPSNPPANPQQNNPAPTEETSPLPENESNLPAGPENGENNDEPEDGDPVEEPTPVGPNNFPAGINPLTGLPVQDPQNLSIPPALVSITNWPTAARPQAGLSFSPIVFELYIGEGMSRFLALFYGDYPEEATAEGQPVGSDGLTTDSAEIGPVRSGRLPYEYLRKFYNGFLVMASAYSGVAANLGEFSNVFGDDDSDINSAMISVTKLADIAGANQARLGNAELTGMAFDPATPPGGQPASRLWFMYNAVDQVIWKYNPDSGAYNRYQDNADGVTFIQAVDKLNNEPLTYENVIVLFARHRQCKEWAFDVDLMYIDRGKALIFRDGKMYDVFWTTKNEEYELTTGKVRPIRFIDANGNPFALKPGQTWVHIVPLGTPYWESEDTLDLYRLLNNKASGTGLWATRFYSSLMEVDQQVCEKIRSK